MLQFYKQLTIPTEVHILKILSRLRQLFFIEFYRGISQSIQDNFKLYEWMATRRQVRRLGPVQIICAIRASCLWKYRSGIFRLPLFWDITQRWMVILYWRFGVIYQSLEDGTNIFSETSVTNFRSTLCNIPEEYRSHISGILYSQ
jgi:hypothetical protein